MNPGDRTVRLTATGLVIFGQVVAVPEEEKEFFEKRPDMIRVRNYSKVDPDGTEVNEYRKGVVIVPRKVWDSCKSKGWTLTPELRTYLDRVSS